MVLVSPAGSATVAAHGLSESPPAAACAASSDSTSARNSAFCEQASSRNAGRFASSCSSAAPTISLIFGHCSGVATVPFLHLSRQPCLGHSPVSFDGGSGNA